MPPKLVELDLGVFLALPENSLPSYPHLLPYLSPSGV